MMDTLPDFPDSFAQPDRAFIYGKPGQWAIIVTLRPFELDGETVETNITLDAFPWRVSHPRELAHTKHDPKYVEGSMYLRDAHHPVDISRIEFGAFQDDSLMARIECAVDFDAEGGGFKNRSFQFDCRIECREPRGVCSFRVIQ